MSCTLPMFPSDLTHKGRVIYSPEQEPVITLSFEPVGALLLIRWHGHITPEKVQIGAQAALAAAQEVPTQTAISDGSAVWGDWLDLLPWVRYDFLPAFIEAGVRALAFLPSADPATRLGMMAFIQAASSVFPAQIHEEEAGARAWLRTFVTDTPLTPSAAPSYSNRPT